MTDWTFMNSDGEIVLVAEDQVPQWIRDLHKRALEELGLS